MTTDASQPRSSLLLILCLLLVAAVYAQILDGPLLWDDRHVVNDSAATRSLDVLSLVKQPFWSGLPGQAGSLAYYRPLTSLSLACDYRLHGDNATGFHLTNLALHLLATGLLFVLLKRRGIDVRLGFLLTATWALLPRLTEGAAWISGRGDVLMTVLVLAAVWVHRPGSVARLALASLLGLLAMLTKESGIAVFGALAVLEVSGRGPARDKLHGRLALLALPVAVYAALRGLAGATSTGDGLALGAIGRCATIFEALGRYAFMLLDPFQPRSLMGQLGRADWPYVAFGAIAFAALLIVAPRLQRLAPQTKALTVLGVVPLALVLHLTALPFVSVAADRYLYLPTAALMLAAAPALQVAVTRYRHLLVGISALMLACAVCTYARLGDYADEARFWVVAARATPNSVTALCELGNVAYRAGLSELALGLAERATVLDIDGNGQPLQNAALFALASGQEKLAARLGDELVKRFPGNPDYRLRRAVIALNAHNFAKARAFAEQSHALAPSAAAADAFLDLVERSRAAAAQPDVPDAVAQSLDAEAMRCPEIIARLERLLESPQGDRTTIQLGVDYIIAHGDPQQARALFEKYKQRFGDADSRRFGVALALRLEDATRIQATIDAFLKGG